MTNDETQTPRPLIPPQSKYRISPGARRPTGAPIELALQSGAYGGKMIARQTSDEGSRVVFVQGGIPGETVRADLTVEKKTFAEARASSIAAASPYRAAPPCPYFGENGVLRGPVPLSGALQGARGVCGGCHYQHIDEAGQLDLKRGIVADLMQRQARLPDHVEVLPVIPSPQPWRYRNRARWTIDEEGLPSYRQGASDRLLSVNLCHIIQPELEAILTVLAGTEWRLPLRTLVDEITARTATPWYDDDDPKGRPERIVELVLHARRGAKRRDLRMFAGDLGTALPGVNGVSLSHALEAGAVLGSGGSLYGAGYFDARFNGFRFRLAPLTFFQVNEETAELMVADVLTQLGDLKGKSVLDIYAGAGTFAFPIARKAEQVLALENDPLAIDDAHYSTRANKLENVHVIPGDAEVELEGLPVNAAAAAVLDPPRAGLGEGVIAQLARIGVDRVVYVSCDPATLARDLRRFGERGYTVERIQPIDLFPQTYHIETIVTLSR